MILKYYYLVHNSLSSVDPRNAVNLETKGPNIPKNDNQRNQATIFWNDFKQDAVTLNQTKVNYVFWVEMRYRSFD